MIRDPSDGSVREAPKPEVGIPTTKPKLPDTGIRQPTRTDAQERLERSREWLKDYHARKDEPHARGNFGGEEHQAAGHPGDGEGKTEPGLSSLGRADR